MTSDSAYQIVRHFVVAVASSEAGPPNKTSTVWPKKSIIMAMSTMLSLVNTSSQRKTATRKHSDPQTQRRQFFDARPHADENDAHQRHFVATTPVGSHSA
jgi:hypothetical protein